MTRSTHPVIDGSPVPSGEAQQADRELIVHGQGIGSAVDLEVSTADIRACAVGLGGLASDLRAAAQRASLAGHVTSSTAHLTSGGQRAVEEAHLVAADGERRATSIEDLAERIELIAARYEAADAGNEAQIWSIPRMPWVLNALTPWVHISTAWHLALRDAWHHGQWLPTRAGTGMALEETIWALTGMDDGVAPAATVVGGALALVTGDGMRVTQIGAPGAGATAGSGTQTTEHAAIGDVEGVVEAIDGLYPDHGNASPGTVRIDKVTAADGSTSWLVLVPGTQGSLVSDHAFDWASNPAGMVGDPTGSLATVLLAMRQAGIRPGQPVVLAGHSQGGFVAVNAANAVADTYQVAGVISVGSPIGTLTAPPGTEVLSIEHVEDPVPGFDNAAVPVSENATTVERVLSASSDPQIAGIASPAGSHGTTAYADTASLLDASDDAAITDFLTSVSGVLNAESVAESAYYQGTRTS